jgi:hypothetical protein
MGRPFAVWTSGIRLYKELLSDRRRSPTLGLNSPRKIPEKDSPPPLTFAGDELSLIVAADLLCTKYFRIKRPVDDDHCQFVVVTSDARMI